MNKLLTHIKNLVRLQEELVCTLKNMHPNYAERRFLLNLSKQGDITSKNTYWGYKKHGAGIAFTNKENGFIVDVCDNIDNVDLFGEWRLIIYLESMHEDDSDIKNQLLNLEEAGYIQRYNNDSKLFLLSVDEQI